MLRPAPLCFGTGRDPVALRHRLVDHLHLGCLRLDAMLLVACTAVCWNQPAFAAPAALQPLSKSASCCAAAMPPLWRQNISRAKRKFRNAMRAVSIFKTAVHSSPDRIERLDSFGESAQFCTSPSTTWRPRMPSNNLCLAVWRGCYVEQQVPKLCPAAALDSGHRPAAYQAPGALFIHSLAGMQHLVVICLQAQSLPARQLLCPCPGWLDRVQTKLQTTSALPSTESLYVSVGPASGAGLSCLRLSSLAWRCK